MGGPKADSGEMSVFPKSQAACCGPGMLPTSCPAHSLSLNLDNYEERPITLLHADLFQTLPYYACLPSCLG